MSPAPKLSWLFRRATPTHRPLTRSADSVAHWVARFNAEGMEALEPKHGGGSEAQYGLAERQRILREFARPPSVCGMGRPPCRLERSNRLSARQRTAYRMSVPIRSDESCTKLTTPGNKAGVGARQVKSCVAGNPCLSRSRILTPCQKKPDRARVSRRGAFGAIGLVHGSSRPLPDQALFRPELSSHGFTGAVSP